MLISLYERDMYRRALSEGTIDKRVRLLRRCQRAVGKPLLEADTDELTRWLDARKVQDRTRYSYISHLAAFWSWAVEHGHANEDATTRIVRPHVIPGIPRPMRLDDVHHVIDQAPTRHLRAMLILGYRAGLRVLEMSNLDADHVLLEQDEPVLIAHGKGRKTRIIPLSPSLAATIGGVLPRRGPVFTRDDGRTRLPPWYISQLIRNHMHACGVESSAHRLRHTFATRTLRESGGDLRLVQELLGHSSPSTTAVYAAWDQRKARAVMTALDAEATYAVEHCSSYP